jgi:hypothetical protein
MSSTTPQILAWLVLTAHAPAEDRSQETAEGAAASPASVRLSAVELPRVPPPSLLRMRGSPVRPLTLREKLEDLSFDPIDVAPKPTTIVYPSANPYATPRVATGVGAGHTVVLGSVEMYARGGAEIGLDATPVASDDDRNLTVVPLGRFGVQVRPTRRMEVGVDVARLGGPSFDPLGEEVRALASLRWRFALVPRR